MKFINVRDLIVTIDAMRAKALPAKVSYAFYRNKETLIKALEVVDKTRIDCLKKYAILDEHSELKLNEYGEAIFETPEHLANFNKECNSFMMEEAKDLNLYKIPLSYLDGVVFDSGFMENLLFMIEEPAEFKPKQEQS